MTRRFLALNGAAALVGLVVGLAAVLFRYAISLIENVAFLGSFVATAQEESRFIVSPWGWAVLLVPTIGGLLVGQIRTLWPETRQQGIAEVMAAVQAQGGVLKGRSSWGHAIISAITVGTGGSTGREGPIGYIGAAVGSSFGRRLGFGRRDMTVLLGSGFTSGIAATFNAPLGAVLLSFELILPEFSTHALIPLVLAAVTGVTVSQLFLGDQATFFVSGFTLGSPWELAAYLALGLLCGLGGVAFIRTLGWSQRAWGALHIPGWLKPGVGGLLVGLAGLGLLATTDAYHIFGTGYATVSALLHEQPALLSIPLLLALILIKPLATATTIGSGGGGGVFSASLYTGALYGALVGIAVHWLAQQAGWATASLGGVASYALVGMAAFYAATARATLTAIVIVAELANEYTILLPVMLAAVTADSTSIALSRDSVYTVRLAQRGILFDHDRTTSPLDLTRVKEVMTKPVQSIPADVTVGEAFNRMIDLGHTGYPVTEADGGLAGVITRRDLSRQLAEGRGKELLANVITRICITATPDEVLHRARDRMVQKDVGRLIVVDAQDRRKIVGILTRSDLVRAEAQKDVEHGDFFES